MTMATSIPWSIFRYEKSDTEPTLTVPGETVVWEKGEGQGEFNKAATDTSAGTNLVSTRLGQQFTIGTTTADGDFLITSLISLLFRTGTPGIANFDIYAVDGNGKPTGSALSSGTTNADTLTTNSAGELRTVTMSQARLSAGTMYVFVIKAAGAGGGNIISIRRSTANPYSGGKEVVSVDSGANWTVDPNDDYYFDIQGGGKYLLIHMDDGDNYQATLTKAP